MACSPTVPALVVQALHRADADAPGRGPRGVLDEAFTYSDGSKQTRIWRLNSSGDGRFVGRADDVVGEAQGQSAGNAFHWTYTMRLPVDEAPDDVQFDDWMYLMTDKVMLNKATMSKFGVRLGRGYLVIHQALSVEPV